MPFERGAGDDFFEFRLGAVTEPGFVILQIRVVFIEVITGPFRARHLHRHFAVQVHAWVAGVGLDHAAVEAAVFDGHVAVVDLDVIEQVGVEGQTLTATRYFVHVIVSVARVEVVVHVHAVDDEQVLPGLCAVDADVGRGDLAGGFAVELIVIELHVRVGAQQAGDVAITGRQAVDHLPVDHLLALVHRVHGGNGCTFDHQHVVFGRRQNRHAVGGGGFPLQAAATEQAGEGFLGAHVAVHGRAVVGGQQCAFRADLPAGLM